MSHQGIPIARISRLLVVFLSLLVLQGFGINHIGEKHADLVNALQAKFHKPVIWQEGVLDRISAAQKKGNDLDQAIKKEVTVFEGDNVVYLANTIPPGPYRVRIGDKITYLAQPHPAVECTLSLKDKLAGIEYTDDCVRHLSVDVENSTIGKSWEETDEGQGPVTSPQITLSKDQLQSISQTILHTSRLLEAWGPYIDRPNGPLSLLILVDARKLKLGATISVVAVLKSPYTNDYHLASSAGHARIVYGELQGGQYSPEWDSPLLDDCELQIRYRDFTGSKTTKQIELISNTCGARLHYPMLTVLDLNGRELTREERGCANDVLPSFKLYEKLCPIIGTTFEIVNAEAGGLEILVRQDFDNTEGVQRDYVLKNGVYKDVAVSPPSSRKTQPAKLR
jgi:hypothetical protein